MGSEDHTKKSRTGAHIVRFIFFSLIGVLFFFIPFNGLTPMVLLVGWLKSVLAGVKNYLTLIICLALVITFILSKITAIQALKNYHKEDGWFKGILYILALIFTILVAFDLGPEWFLNGDVGGLAIGLAGTVLITVSVCGLMVVFVLNSGLVEFLGALIEPLMRPLFRLPGRAAVDCLASFVSAPAVGVYFTDQAYQMKIYTEREAFTVMTCWSVCSLGFFAVICGIAGIDQYYGSMVLASLICCFVLSFLNIRIWPWRKRPVTYIDGTVQTREMLEERQKPEGGRFNLAIGDAVNRVSAFGMAKFVVGAKDALAFTQKIVAYVASIASIALVVCTYTPLFTWIGYPLIPLFKLLGFGADAAVMAPAALVGISEIAMPAILVSGGVVAEKSAFFICLLSTLQIIFFTESANAMLESNVKMNVGQLVVVFLLRTLTALPLCWVATTLVFM